MRVDTGFYSIPEGANNYHHRQNQTTCKPGYYCVNGVRHKCPAGRYGTVERLAHRNCSAECPVGHYCPEGSPDPIMCPAGRYGESTGLSTSDCTNLCRPGFYCPAGSIMANQTACRAGIYGAEYGLTNSQCSPHCEQGGGPNATSSKGNGKFCEARACEAGYYCTEASVSPRNFDCGNASYYCPHHRVGPLLLTMDSIALGSTRSRNSYKMIVMHIYATHRSCASVAIIACMACGISVLGATTVARLV